MKRSIYPIMLALALCGLVSAQGQSANPIRSIRDAVKLGEDGIPVIAGFAKDPSLDVRIEAVKRLTEIGGPKTVDPLLGMLADRDAEVQIRAIDGLVNVYVPGYLKIGVSRSISRGNDEVRAKFDDDAKDLVADAFVVVPPEVIAGLGTVLRSRSNPASRAAAARAIGILRGRSAAPDLIEALYSKDDPTMLESLLAIQKLRDPALGPEVMFLLKDLAEPIQIAALETVGILRTNEARSGVLDVLAHPLSNKVAEEAMESLGMIANPADHRLFQQYLGDRNKMIRMGAAEGLARIHDPSDLNLLNQAFSDERESDPRLALAFALVAVGRRDVSQFSPLQLLVNTLNRSSQHDVALAYLTELTRDPAVRRAIYPMIPSANRDEKIGIAIVLGRSGDTDSRPFLEALQNDADPQVAREGIRALRTLQTRIQ